MPYYAHHCSLCDAPIYVTFKKKDGRESVQTRVARGAVQFEFHLKSATHSGTHITVKHTYCVGCAPVGMVESWQEIRPQLLDPNGIDPPPPTPISRKERARLKMLAAMADRDRETQSTTVTTRNERGSLAGPPPRATLEGLSELGNDFFDDHDAPRDRG